MNQTFVQPKLPFLVSYSCWFPLLMTLLFPLETSEWRGGQEVVCSTPQMEKKSDITTWNDLQCFSNFHGHTSHLEVSLAADSDSAGVRWGLRVWVSKELPGHTSPVGPHIISWAGRPQFIICLLESSYHQLWSASTPSCCSTCKLTWNWHALLTQMLGLVNTKGIHSPFVRPIGLLLLAPSNTFGNIVVPMDNYHTVTSQKTDNNQVNDSTM